MDKDPFTVGELVKYLSEFPQDHEFRIMGYNGELFFHRFKQRGETLLTMELDDPGTIEQMDSLAKRAG